MPPSDLASYTCTDFESILAASLPDHCHSDWGMMRVHLAMALVLVSLSITMCYTVRCDFICQDLL